MSAWQDAAEPFFNPTPAVSEVSIAPGRVCIVVDEALSRPERLVEWAAEQSFGPPRGYPYPGLVLDAPAALRQRIADHFAIYARRPLGGRRTVDVIARLSMVTTPPDQLAPLQWQCHRDRIAAESSGTLFAAAVLYLFRDPDLGGTSFYAPRQSETETEQLVADSHVLDAAAFGARHGLRSGYMAGSNRYFERVAGVRAAWNRLIYYDGAQFHSADINRPDALSANARVGRLTLNGFYTCTCVAQ